MANEFNLPDDVVEEIIREADREGETPESAARLLTALQGYDEQCKRTLSAMSEGVDAAQAARADGSPLDTLRVTYAPSLATSAELMTRIEESVASALQQKLERTAEFARRILDRVRNGDAMLREILSEVADA